MQAALTTFALFIGMMVYAWHSSAKILPARIRSTPVPAYVKAPEKPIDIAIFIDSITICWSEAFTSAHSKSSIVAPTTQQATSPSEAPTSPTTALSHSTSSSPSSTGKGNGKRVSFAVPLATTLVHPAATCTHSHARAGILLSRSRPWSRQSSSNADSDNGAQKGSASEQPRAAFAFTSADTLAMGTANSPLHRTSSEVSFEDWLLQGSEQGLAADSLSCRAPADSGAFSFPQQPPPQVAPTKPTGLPRRSPALLEPTTAAEASMGEEHNFTVLAEAVLRTATTASKAGSLCDKAAQAARPVCRLGSSAVRSVDRNVMAAARAVVGYSSRQGQQVVAVASMASSGSTKLLQRCGSSLKRRFTRLVRQASYSRDEVALPA